MVSIMKRIMEVLGTSNVTDMGLGEVEQHLNNLPKADSSILTGIVNFALYVAGILAVVMIIVGGVQMTTSAGNPNAVAKAKRTITYSIVGLIVAVLAYAIVNFVVAKVAE